MQIGAQHTSFNSLQLTKANTLTSQRVTTLRDMGGNKQRKSSSFLSVFNIFKSNNKHRGGGYNAAYEDGLKQCIKVWPSDEDRGRWGVADPVIDMRATAFIEQYKKRISEQ